ncbi:MAG: transpeptidase family protein [Chlorobiaceae bacterium]|nr:transpeptidase family protein [Chlorobiaceae bacterium]NTW73348.1 transpeptidase family protein [Chlorobiaceae bacterium]
MNEHSSTSSNTASDDREFGQRLGVMGIVMALFFVAIVFKLLSIQVFNVKKYKAMASRQYESIVTEKARRGRIFDRNGRQLAESIESISFWADPRRVSRPQELATRLSSRFGKSRSYYLRLLQSRKRFVWLERNVPVSMAAELMPVKMAGFGFRREQQRYYLNIASQIIGFTDRDDRGISGLERQLNADLKGRDGTRIFQRSATGERYPAPDADQILPLSGSDVELTIDADIQGIVEDEIMQAVMLFRARAAAGIVMDVKTGEIIAMANYPGFDMNHRATVTSEQTRNRAVTDMFEPGSTFKIVMAAAATEALHYTASTIVDGHNGSIQLYDRRIVDHAPMGRITFKEAIMESSNVVAATTAMRVGPETFHRYATNLGFGRKTGVGLMGESRGILKPIREWDRTTLPWMGYGYQVMATPLQLLQAYATIANDGVRMKPYIIRRIVDREGEPVRESKPEQVVQAVSPETARYLAREYFRAVVEKGTGMSAAVEGIPVAGKTGTAQKYNGGYQGRRSYLSTFVGFFPVDKPQYGVIVIVDEPQTAYYAAAVAAPVFSRICGRSVACSREMQRRLAMRSTEKSNLDRISTVAVPELKGLTGREAERLLKWNGLGAEFNGHPDDVVAAQSVATGTKVQKELVVRLTMAGRPRRD